MADEWTVTSSHFGLFIDSLTGDGEIGMFQKVSGLGVQLETEDIVEGGQNQFVHKLPGRLRWQDIELERGLISSNALFTWLMNSAGDGLADAGNAMKRHSGSIVMYSADGKRLRQWNFTGAFPVSWNGPAFDATSDEVTTEKLVLAHDGIVPAT